MTERRLGWIIREVQGLYIQNPMGAYRIKADPVGELVKPQEQSLEDVALLDNDGDFEWKE